MDFMTGIQLSLTPFVVFGLLLIFGTVGGFLAHKISWLPSITGFMIIGFLIGPNVLNLLSYEAMAESKIFIDIALALILYRLGLSLDLVELSKNPKFIIISAVESFLTFILVFLALYMLNISIVISLIISAIVISSSPAVLLHVAHEVNAKGKVTESTKNLVALNNVISFVMFSTILPLLHYKVGDSLFAIILQPLYRLLGSVVLGVFLGVALHYLSYITFQATQYRLALVIGMSMIGIGIASELHLSLLLVPLIFGITIRTMEKGKIISEIEFGSAFELFFIILFVYAGAGLHISEIIKYALSIFVVVAIRMLAKICGVVVASKFFKIEFKKSISMSILLFPMAGLAIGLTQTLETLFNEYTSSVTAIVLGSVAIFETIGPILAKYAFRLCGEAGSIVDPNVKTYPSI